VSATLEVTTPELAEGLRALGFVDAGYVWNNDPDGLNKPPSDRLASVGLGLRYARGPFAASLDYGRLVLGSRIPLTVNSAAPQTGEDRWYMNVGVRF
jgi:hemolysin activation/secretion protein